MRKTNIALIGMMGTFKSSAGKLLAQALKKTFEDTDALIEQDSGKTIPELFAIYGEAHFRALERQVIERISSKKNRVISCGGGVAMDENNMSALKKGSIVVLLWSDADVIYRRITDPSGRPLLKEGYSEEKLKNIIAERKQRYIQAADFTINNNNLTSLDTAKAIEDMLTKIIK